MVATGPSTTAYNYWSGSRLGFQQVFSLTSAVPAVTATAVVDTDFADYIKYIDGTGTNPSNTTNEKSFEVEGIKYDSANEFNLIIFL